GGLRKAERRSPSVEVPPIHRAVPPSRNRVSFEACRESGLPQPPGSKSRDFAYPGPHYRKPGTRSAASHTGDRSSTLPTRHSRLRHAILHRKERGRISPEPHLESCLAAAARKRSSFDTASCPINRSSGWPKAS